MFRGLYHRLPLLKDFWLNSARMDILTFLAAVAALSLLFATTLDHITAGLVLQESASKLALALREAESIARDRNCNISAYISTTKTRASSLLVVEDGSHTFLEQPFPEGVSVVGSITFDQHGVPIMPTHFVFRKLGTEIHVDVNANSEVTIP